MPTTITLEEAAANLGDVIEKLEPGREVLITKNRQPVAKLTKEQASQPKPRVPGNCKGMITLLVEDEEHLRDFAEYMP